MGIVKRNSITITVLSYVGVAVGFINQILLLPNFLSAEQVGLAAILVNTAMMYAQFSALGINQTVIRFFPFFRSHRDNGNNGLLAWSVMGISAGFILFTLLFLLLREPVTAYFAKNSPLFAEHYLLLVPLAFTLLFNLFFGSWLQALHKTVVSSFAYDVILRLLITAEISLYALGAMDFEQFLIGYVLLHYVPTLILVVYAAAIGQLNLRIDRSKRTLRLLSIAGIYGLWQFLGGASLIVIPVIDQLMLAGMVGLAASGIYSRMQYVVSAIMVPYRSIIKVASPLVAGFWKERDMEQMRKIYRSASLMNLIIGCYFFLVVWVNLDNLFAMMPPEYAFGRYVFLFLGIGRVFDMYAGLNGVILVTSKKYRYDLGYSLLLLALTVATNALLIPRWGIVGAAVATMGTTLLWNLLRILTVWRFYRLQPFAWKDLGVAAFSAALIGVSMLIPAMGNFITDAVIRTLVITALFCGGIYRWGVAPELNAMADNFFGRFRRKGC